MNNCCFLACFCASQRVQRRKAELTLAQIREKLGRLAPNLAHMCKFIWAWIFAKQIATGYTRWHLAGFRGSTIQKSGEAVRLAPTLGHVCGFIWEWTYAQYKSPLNTPGGISEGGGRVSQIQKSGEAVKRLDRLAPNLAHICRSTWEWI